MQKRDLISGQIASRLIGRLPPPAGDRKEITVVRQRLFDVLESCADEAREYERQSRKKNEAKCFLDRPHVKKGIFRVWVVASLSWLCFMAFVLITSPPDRGELDTIATVVAGVPLSVVIVYVLLANSMKWIIAGFKDTS